MITNFNTPQVGGSKGGGMSITTVILLLAGAYVAYRFVIKPMLDKKSEENA